MLNFYVELILYLCVLGLLFKILRTMKKIAEALSSHTESPDVLAFNPRQPPTDTSATTAKKLIVNVRRTLLKVGVTAILESLGLFWRMTSKDADLVTAVEDGFVHECSVFGSLPPGYMRMVGGRIVYHNPKFCPRASSLDTVSTYLSEDSSDQGLGSDMDNDVEVMSNISWIV